MLKIALHLSENVDAKFKKANVWDVEIATSIYAEAFNSKFLLTL